VLAWSPVPCEREGEGREMEIYVVKMAPSIFAADFAMLA
jgi:hypothetical protein